MTDFKIKVNPQESELVQKLLFLAGYSWNSGSTDIKHLNQPFLYFDANTLTKNDDSYYFNNDNNPEITFDEFLDEIEIDLNNKL